MKVWIGSGNLYENIGIAVFSLLWYCKEKWKAERGIQMIIILAVWLALIFWGMSENINGVHPFEQPQALALRGICAVEIMMGHIGLATGNMVLYPNRKAGILFVGIFFMLSGYGVAYSAEHKEGYMKNFLLLRTVKLLLPAYTVKIIVIVIETLLVYFRGTIIDINFNGFLTDFNWYVYEQLFFYFVYWLAYKLFPKYIEATVGICSLVLIIAAFAGGMDNPWYGSSLCFVLGLCYYKFEKRNYKFRRYYALLTIMGLVLGTSMAAFFLLGNDSILGNPIARNAASVSFCIIVVMLLYKLRVGNAVSRFLGKCSYEIFLIHSSILGILKAVSIDSVILLGILTVVLSVVLAYLIHLMVISIRGLFERMSSKEKV